MYICAYVTKTRIIWFGHALSWMLFGSSAIFALQLIYFHFIYCVLSHHVSRLKPRTTDLISDISKLKPLDVFQQVTTHFHPFPLERLLSKPTVYSATVCVSTCAASAKSRCIMHKLVKTPCTPQMPIEEDMPSQMFMCFRWCSTAPHCPSFCSAHGKILCFVL